MRNAVRVEVKISKTDREDLEAFVELQCNLVRAISRLVWRTECSLLLENFECSQEHLFGFAFNLKNVRFAHSTKDPQYKPKHNKQGQSVCFKCAFLVYKNTRIIFLIYIQRIISISFKYKGKWMQHLSLKKDIHIKISRYKVDKTKKT